MNSRSALGLVLTVLLLAPGCTDRECGENEEFVVDEVGTCAPMPLQFTLKKNSCRVSVDKTTSLTGLPPGGSPDPTGAPLREGGFILYSQDDQSPFRLCRARRVDFRLELSCVDGKGTPVCQATLTERPQ